MNSSMTLMAFQRKYRTEEDCVQAIFEARWMVGNDSRLCEAEHKCESLPLLY
ncbi:hypothetical protein BH11CYA1_BH11CYA1_09610 [soil metagenome]